MKTKLQQVLEHCLRGRTVAVWGTPTRMLLRELAGSPWEEAGTVRPDTHYVVAPTDQDLDDFLLDPQADAFQDVEDYLCFADLGKELPFDWELFGAKIGRQSYFGEPVANACQEGYIESIGRFTSINSSAMIHVDHHRNMSFISDELEYFFTPENRARYRARYLADPKHPYNTGKPRLVIGSDVWIGARAFINCSKVCSIGDGAIIGAGAVVNQDVPPYAVVAGVPGKILKYRYEPELIAALLRTRWWDWDETTLNQQIDALLDPKVFLLRFGGHPFERT